MKISTFNSKDIILVTDLTDYQEDYIEGQYPVLYHDKGFYIPGDCLQDLLNTYEPTELIHN